mgnify:CR=1 FL=1
MTLIAEGLAVNLTGKMLISDVALTITPGKILAIVGPNGAGKSTLLKVLVGELKPMQGSVRVEDRLLSAWGKRDLAQIRAVLPQNSTLSFGFTAAEVVLMGRIPHLTGGESYDDRIIATEAMAMTHTDHLAERIYTTLSGGERQRVQLARVLAQIWEGKASRYLLLDEPTNNLDLSHQHSTLMIARQFAQRGVGVLAVLHDLNLAAQYADTVLVLKGGRVLAEGKPDKVFTPQII